ncbi:Beta-1 [Mactra antiquata]
MKSGRKKSVVFLFRVGLHSLWLGLMLLSFLQLLIAYSEEVGLEHKHTMASESDCFTQENFKDALTDDNGKHVSVRHNVSEVNLSNVTKADDSDATASNKSEKSEGKFMGELGKQYEFERVKVDFYKNKTRPLSCDKCFQTNFSFVSSSICNSSSGNDKVDIIILIPTAYTHVRHRMALRTTWLSRTMKNTAKVRYAFILGQAGSQKVQQDAFKEKKTYNDMVFANFSDTFANLTLKTLAAFHWVNTWCPHAMIIVKADDDVYMNLDNLITFVSKNLQFMQKTVFGGCWARQINRDPDSPYYVSYKAYANNTLADTCSGSTYITGSSVVKRILRVSPNIPFFHLEEMYVSFCMKKLDIKAQKQQGILPKIGTDTEIPLCVFKGNILISSHVRYPRKIEQIWRAKCTKSVEQKKPS